MGTVCQYETQIHNRCVNWVSLHFVCFVFPLLVTFSVMCYNVLCDKYCTRQIYGYCPSWALDWEYRKTAILKEILHYGADILGLQVMCKHSLCRNWFVFLTFIIYYHHVGTWLVYILSINWTKHWENIGPFKQ